MGSSIKSLKVSRGYTYSYFFSAAAASGKPTLLFLHGIPSTHQDWRHQIQFFIEKGFGVIAPDMLGYGGTDKPTNPEQFAASKTAKDVLEIVEKENAENVIVIAHDW
jgi:soluble epoxide hydrolase / lipid-phosphate phosphatase